MSRVCQCGGVIRENGKAFWDILPSCSCQFPVAIQYNYFTNLTTRIMKPMKDKELDEQTSDQLAQQLIDELKSKGMVIVEREEMIDLIAQERRKARQEGFDEAWAKNVKSSLCFMHEHDVRWCDECRGELKEEKDYSCEICGADPMGVDCNNANCDR